MTIDYSQFLSMSEEVSLLAVVLVLFIADLFTCGKEERALACATADGAEACGCSCCGHMRALLPVVLLLAQTIFILCNISTDAQAVNTAFGGMYESTGMMTALKATLNVGAIIVFLMSSKWLGAAENRIKQGEFYTVTLFTLLGMYFMISSGHFLMFFIGLELASIPMTALIAYDKKRTESAEAGAKFILLALFSAALLLYGISLLYGAAGTLYFSKMASMPVNLLSILGLVLFISGMGFKISLVPFHLWTADTYEGAPTPVTAFLSVISKGSAAFVLFTILAKVFGAGSGFFGLWSVGFFWIIVVSITVANLFAIRQKNLKRFMAFSAISQAGYLVLAVMGVTEQGMAALVFYLLVYLAANLGAFAVIHVIEQNSGKVGIDDYNGLYQTNPKLAFLMTLCLFSLAGIPPFAGFFSKFFVFMAAFNAGYYLLVFIALVNTVISLYYYLLIVKAMYIQKNDAPIAAFTSDCGTRAALVLCTIGVILLGIVSVFYDGLSHLAGITL